MILPIIAYGSPVLRKVCAEVDQNDPKLAQLIEDMYETMYASDGVGLAAPQINESLRLFIVDASSFAEDEPALASFKKTFINPEMIEESGEEWQFKEGCLSIPGIRENVSRQETIKLKYFDEKFQLHEEEFSGVAARVIQHEYDHIEAKLFIDKINPMKRRMLKGKLNDISKGKVKINYRMKFPV